MFAVVKKSKFTGITYNSITGDIIAHHAQFDEVLAEIDQPLVDLSAPLEAFVQVVDADNPDAPPAIDERIHVPDYGEPTDVQLAAVTEWNKKNQRGVEVDAITVEVEGMVFDGNEQSQQRMDRAARTMEQMTIPTMRWKLSDNSFVDVTASQLTQATALAGQQQADIWEKFG